MPDITLDPETNIVEEHFAIIYAPRRNKARALQSRFADSCVEVMDSLEVVLKAADPVHQRYPARVVGPSSSSEGVQLYYLIEWLT